MAAPEKCGPHHIGKPPGAACGAGSLFSLLLCLFMPYYCISLENLLILRVKSSYSKITPSFLNY